MSLEDNNGSQYYAKPIGVVSVSPNLTSNNGTSYYWLSANDYILWCQPTKYPHPQSNNTLQYYFYQCNVPSDAWLDLQANNGTAFYYQSASNGISFEPSPSYLIYNGASILYNGGYLTYN